MLPECVWDSLKGGWKSCKSILFLLFKGKKIPTFKLLSFEKEYEDIRAEVL